MTDDGKKLKSAAAAPEPSSNVTAQEPAFGSQSWVAKVIQERAEVDAKREAATVYQLAFWPDDKRAMPGDFIACALFSALHGKDAEYVERLQLASINGLTVSFTGRRLTQVHADVWEAVMHMARQFPQGSLVKCSARQLLRLMGRQTGGKQRDDLDLWINQLTATSVVIRDDASKERFRGSLLPRSADKEDTNDTAYSFDINRDLARILSANLFLVDWEKRRQLQRKPLASWLQRHFSRFHKPVAISELYRLSDSKTKRLVDFRKQLRVALGDLQQIGIIGTWDIDAATDTLRIMPPSALPPKRGDFDSRPALPPPGQTALPFKDAPAISAETHAKFQAIHPDADVEQCLADFAAWLSKSGKSAEKPNAAFLGFARKWHPR